MQLTFNFTLKIINVNFLSYTLEQKEYYILFIIYKLNNKFNYLLLYLLYSIKYLQYKYNFNIILN